MNEFSPAIPIFRMFDENKAREFYVDFLGFEINFEHRFADDLPLYMSISRGSFELHLSEHHGDGSPGSRIRVSVSDVAEFQRELSRKQYKFSRPGFCDQDWGWREMIIDDPFGNKLVFCQDLRD